MLRLSPISLFIFLNLSHQQAGFYRRPFFSFWSSWCFSVYTSVVCSNPHVSSHSLLMVKRIRGGSIPQKQEMWTRINSFTSYKHPMNRSYDSLGIWIGPPLKWKCVKQNSSPNSIRQSLRSTTSRAWRGRGSSRKRWRSWNLRTRHSRKVGEKHFSPMY